MTLAVLLIQALLLAGTPGSVAPGDRAELDFERRVAAERVILRSYLRHQQGVKDPDSILNDALLRKRVSTYLEKSLALEQNWATPVTREMLRAEWKRIVDNTRFPDRLAEIRRSLGDDPVLILECFVRPVLVDRLTRAFFDFDREIHREAREKAERLRFELESGALHPADEHPARVVALAPSEVLEEDLDDGLIAPDRNAGAETAVPPTTESFDGPERTRTRLSEEGGAFVVRSVEGADSATYRFEKRTWDSWWEEARQAMGALGLQPVTKGDEILELPETMADEDPCADDDMWDNGSLDVSAEIGRGHVAVWTGTQMLVWGTRQQRHALLYDPLTDAWSKSTEVNAPNWRQHSTAVWTGSEMVVWGGSDAANYYNTGGRYNPVADVWTPTSIVNAPLGRQRHTAVWTGDRMIVWGGYGGASKNSGGQYDPATDTWIATSTVNAPSPRNGHIAVWTGTEMIVWGALSANNTGGRYDPTLDQWVPTSNVGVPLTGGLEAAVWTGSHMVIWGRNSSGQWAGGRYDPATDTWTAASSTGAPLAVLNAEAVWTGSEMIVWGGHFGALPSGADTGGRYDPQTDQWAPTSLVNAPQPRYDHSAVWTGTHMIVWGGVNHLDGVTPLGTGGRYDPATDTWTPTSGTNNGPTHRFSHTAVWTGTHMIVWGGVDHLPLNTGGLYDPMTDSWTPTDTTGAPAGTYRHTAVWTGERMLVWGGFGIDGTPMAGVVIPVDSGRAYDPMTNQWTAISSSGAPASRTDHTAVWTGDRMLVWGGAAGSARLGDGKAYDPAADTWQPISTTGAPSPRSQHSAIWTGSRMIVWGGNGGGSLVLGDGARYDPNSDDWSAISATDAPAARYGHSAVWTEDSLIVWGGRSSCCIMSTGGRYEVDQDEWSPIATSDSPSARVTHSAIWTGDLMVVWGGGAGPTLTQTGGRYSPFNDKWEPTSTVDAPTARAAHTAVWTGEFMLVWGGSGTNYATGGRYRVVPGPDADDDGFHDCVTDCSDSDATIYPGATQVCGDGLNNDCSHALWPSLVGTNEGDDDGDGLSECQGDCTDALPSAWETPREVRDLSLSADTVSLSWLAPVVTGASSVRYDTLRSTLSSDFIGAATCVEADDGTDTFSTDGSVPTPGSIVYYLVRAENDCPAGLGIGPLGFDSGGAQNIGRSCP